MSCGTTCVIQVTNLSAAVTSEQMRTLFTFLGDIEELRLYPPDNAPLAFSSKVCYIKYRDPSSVGVAQHLTNTVFIDRALIVVPCAEVMQPTRTVVMCNTTFDHRENTVLGKASMLDIVWFMNHKFPVQVKYQKKPRLCLFWLQLLLYLACFLEQVCFPFLHQLQHRLLLHRSLEEKRWRYHCVPFTTLATTLPTPLEPVIPSLAPVIPALTPAIPALNELPQPPLMGNVDPTKVDEIRRTIYVGNLNSQNTTAEQLLEFFKQVGDVRFVRMAGDETQPTRFAFVEFADQNSVNRALTFNGVMFGDRPLKINHSNNAIVKPPELTPQAAAKELEEVMKRVREAQSLISEAIEPETGKPVEKAPQKRSKTRSRSRSKSRSRRKRSHSKHRSRSPNRSRSRHKEHRRSKSPHKKRSKSRDRHKSRSRSRSREKKRDKEYKSKAKEREKAKDRSDKRRKEKRSRSPLKNYPASRRSRSVSREKRKKRSRSLSKSPKNSKSVKRSSRSPSPRSKNRKEKKRGRDRDHIEEGRERERSASKKASSKEREIKSTSEKYDHLKEKDHLNEEKNNKLEEDVKNRKVGQGDTPHNGNHLVTEDSPSSLIEES